MESGGRPPVESPSAPEHSAVTLTEKAEAGAAGERWLLGIALALAGSVALFSSAASIVFWCNPWSNGRLAPALALLRGYPLYQPPGTGPVLGLMYGPLAVLSYLPACLVRPPSRAILLGSVLSLFFCTAPVAAIAWRHARRLGAGLPWVPAAGTVAFLLLSVWLPSLNYSTHAVHADAPALGLAGAAVAICTANPRIARRRTLVAAAALGVAAVFAKQVMLFVPFGLLLYIGWVAGRRAAGTFLLCTALWAAVGLGLVAWYAGLATFGWHVITIPAQTPWGVQFREEGRTLAGKIQALGEMVRGGDIDLWMTAVVAYVAGLACVRRVRGYLLVRGIFDRPERAPWTLALLVAVLGIPAALAGRAKWGGDVNAFSVVTYFAAMAVALLAVEAFAPGRKPARGRKAYPAAVLAAAALAVLVVRGPGDVRTLEHHAASADLSDEAFEFARRHPGEAYFPWEPLSTLMAGEPAAHFASAILERHVAGFPVPASQFLAHVPAGLKYVAYPRAGFVSFNAHAPLSEFTEPTFVPELPDFRVFQRRGTSAGPRLPRLPAAPD